MITHLKGLHPQTAIQVLRNAQCFFLDVDSTLIHEEGLDEFARYLGKYKEVCSITNQAMAGEISYVEGFEKRMDLLHPTIDQMNSFLRNWNPTLTSGVKEFISYLQNSRKLVYLVSGGISHLVFPVSDKLGIPHDHVLCNEIFFSNGLYSGFDRSRLINYPRGKCLEIERILTHTGKKCSVMIGDGATDLETKDVVDAFICFTGVKDRPSVSSQGDLAIASFQDLLPLFHSPFF